MLVNHRNDRVPAEHFAFMKATPQSTDYSWREKYLEAIWETDHLRLARRIRIAEQFILSRERELFADSRSSSEKSALNNALHALHALRSCLGLEEVSSHQETL